MVTFLTCWRSASWSRAGKALESVTLLEDYFFCNTGGGMHNSSPKRTEAFYYWEAGKQTPAQDRQLHLQKLFALKIGICNGYQWVVWAVISHIVQNSIRGVNSDRHFSKTIETLTSNLYWSSGKLLMCGGKSHISKLYKMEVLVYQNGMHLGLNATWPCGSFCLGKAPFQQPLSEDG